jgi:hypothetical protein
MLRSLAILVPAILTVLGSIWWLRSLEGHSPQGVIESVAGLDPASPVPDGDLDFEAHLRELRQRLPDSDQFHVCLSKPFVVIGNESPEMVERRARQTVQWAVERLKNQYFTADPPRIIDIWLFKDKESYEKYTRELVGEPPHTPFGFYSSEHRALIMNIATGGGTLVHEIVHPFIEANFPECPAWFNEGLASLYEQSTDRDGKIWGLTNWRLERLQQLIVDEQLPSFRELCESTTRSFYAGERGDGYAQARYLCYYLQENDLLAKFYTEFRDRHADDPSGYQVLQDVLGNPDMDDFQTDWERFVVRLRFPERE